MKVDLRTTVPGYDARPGVFSIVELPPATYLAVDGHGDPNTAQEYADALASLHPLAYAVKFLSKGVLGRDYVVMPLEASWWSEDMAAFTARREKSRWEWTVMNRLPDWVSSDHVETARASVASRGAPPLLDRVRSETLHEGLCVQTLHVGPYDDEAAVLDRMHHEFLPANSLRLTGKHHEIYLSDPRRTPPPRLRTVLRQPVGRRARPA